MCLAIAGKVIAIEEGKASVDYNGVIKTAACDLVSELKTGDWVLVHAGFVIQIMDEDYAEELSRLEQEVFDV